MNKHVVHIYHRFDPIHRIGPRGFGRQYANGGYSSYVDYSRIVYFDGGGFVFRKGLASMHLLEKLLHWENLSVRYV